MSAARHGLGRTPHRSEPISLAAAERALGWGGTRGEKLRRYVVAKERVLGKPGAILVVVGTGKKRRERLTLHALRRHCPELWPSKADDLAKNLREYLRSIDERVAEAFAEQVSELVEPRLKELFERQNELSEQVRALVIAREAMPTSARKHVNTRIGRRV